MDAANVYPSPLILLFLAVFTPPASPNARAELRNASLALAYRPIAARQTPRELRT